MTSRRWRKHLTLLAGAALALTLAGTAAGYHYWSRSLPSLAGSRFMPGLTAEVQVIRDSHGVPHIFASSLNDAARALGYLHAQDRFFQMDISRRVLAGRLAEIIGPEGLAYDRLFRTLDLAGRGRDSFAALSEAARAHLHAYAEGVNIWLAESGQALPLEYALLGFEPEPWRPEDAVIWGKGMAWKLSANWRHDALRGALAAEIGRERAERLFPPLQPGSPVTLEPEIRPGLLRGAAPSGSDTGNFPFAELSGAFRALAALPAYGAGASNEWVVSGARSETGMPLLANDPHLELDIPVLWYLARITTPDITLTGATVPGAPHILLGQNGHIAWGFTTTDSDTQDLFIEKPAPDQPDHYMTPDGPQPFISETVSIAVKGEGPVELTRRETRHGPVITGALDDADALGAGGRLVSLAWTGLGRADTSAEAIYRLNLARNRFEFLNALRHFHSPAQNIVYADRDGTTGFINVGRVPIRRSGDGRYPAEGTDGSRDWTGEIPFSGWPKMFDPPAGAIVNANNAVTRPDYPFWFGRDQGSPYRARRIIEMIGAQPKHNLDSFAAIQNDIAAAHAPELLPYLLKAKPQNDAEKLALKLLRKWNMEADKEAPETLIFDWWVWRMNEELLKSRLDPLAPASGILNASVISSILHDPGSYCVAEDLGADCMEAVEAAFEQTVAEMSERYGPDPAGWLWGKEHFAVMRNQALDNIPGFRALFGLAFPSDGGFYSINRGGSLGAGPPDHPLARASGAGFRGLYDLADPSRSLFIIAGGQSAHPLSPHYADLLRLYEAGEYVQLHIDREELIEDGGRELIFTP